MSEESNDATSFTRWQGRSIDQLGFVNNLLIGLATGLLAFQAQLAFDSPVSFQVVEKWVSISSTALTFLSLAVGCYVAWNRLRSFRITAQIAWKREKNQREGIEELRTLVMALDGRTWRLLRCQTVLFVMGGFLLPVVTIIRYLGS